MQIRIDSATLSRAIESSLYIAVEKLVVCVDASLPLKGDALKGRALKRLKTRALNRHFAPENARPERALIKTRALKRL